MLDLNLDNIYNKANNLKTLENVDFGYRTLYPLPTKEEVYKVYRNSFAGKVRKDFISNKKKDQEYSKNVHYRKHLVVTKAIRKNFSRVLDIGCGYGQLLEDFRNFGWDVYGVEPSINFSEHLDKKKIQFSAAMLEQLSFQDIKKLGTFDFINMTNVLEHVLNPIKVCEIATDLLNPGGVFCIESPNDFNRLQLIAYKTLKVDAWWINSLHINYFNKDSIERIMKFFDLIPFYSSSQFPMELFLLMGENYITDKDTGKECHKKRVMFEMSLHESKEEKLLEFFYNSLSELNLGRLISVYGRKPSE